MGEFDAAKLQRLLFPPRGLVFSSDNLREISDSLPHRDSLLASDNTKGHGDSRMEIPGSTHYCHQTLLVGKILILRAYVQVDRGNICAVCQVSANEESVSW